MALYHFSVTQVKRSAGQSAIACASYRAGERLYSQYYDEVSDYSKKGGVIYSEIMLPENAPKEYADRETLWNAVEDVEKHPKAQLAYSFDIALQNELSQEENIDLARRFVKEYLVADGMIADLAVHNPERDGNPNPHIHILTTMRPLNPDGSWGSKQHREYLFDDQGNPVKDEKGNQKYKAVPNTDWGTPEKLQQWREDWANLVNSKFEEKGLPCRIDHRSYENQGIHELPTVHEGPTVRAMELKGIPTEKGEYNRWIRKTNAMIRGLLSKIKEMVAAIKDMREEIKRIEEEPSLADLLMAGRTPAKSSLQDLKFLSADILFLQKHSIYRIDDLENYLEKMESLKQSQKDRLDKCNARRKEVKELISLLDIYHETKPIYEEGMKKFFGKEKYMQENEGRIKQYQMAKRKLAKASKSRGGKLTKKMLEKELAALDSEYSAIRDEFVKSRDEVQTVSRIQYSIQRGLEAKHPHKTRATDLSL
ncbi:MAG: MobA/MobL family protein [Clostridiales bacterium]|nr:MobA/MobL family protein [Clostridiales bacterium]MBR3056650.1 MobA/MobL family protein [Clostridiales bacterium]